jgi:F-type H+-transporting ATPase subunit delta
MRLTRLARRYAAALFETAKSADIIDKVESDLGLITWTLENVPRLSDVLLNPLIVDDDKKNIVQEIFKDKIDEITLDFIFLLIDRKREGILADIEAEYVAYADSWRGIIRVLVTCAVPITDDERNKLTAALEDFTEKKVQLQLEVDASLIGGMIVQIGDTIIDGSVKGYLNALRNRLLGQE